MKVLLFFVLAVLAVTPLLANSTPAVVAGQSVEACGSPYIAGPGETLAMIASKCGTSRSSLLYMNPEIPNSGRISAGQVVRLPGRGEAAAALAPLNTQAPPDAQPGPQSGIPVTGERADQAVKPAGITYTVKRGDTLARIASQHGLAVADLMTANPAVTNPNLIRTGQNLYIPQPEELDQLRADAARIHQERQERIAGEVASGTLSSIDERWIDVDLATQTTRAYEGDRLVRTFVVSTGRPATPTVTGQYRIWIKLRYDDMSGPGYNLKAVPHVMYFYKGYGLHGTFWHNNFGTPMSHGCVNLSEEDAAWLFDFAEVGTLVNVH